MPYLWAIIAKGSAPKFNNSKPREWLSKLEGRGARANWAQQNSFEAMPGFLAAVIIAHLAQAPQHQIDLIAVNFVVLRLFYGYLYLADQATLRSVVWALGVACVVALFVISV
ncbi:MAG TPA: MAPEG family protein, partial [Candidatus Kapabacteria bacterium]|nr:MAPEG family protein [Candidatus Kapabacteria bacterium]